MLLHNWFGILWRADRRYAWQWLIEMPETQKETLRQYWVENFGFDFVKIMGGYDERDGSGDRCVSDILLDVCPGLSDGR